MGRRRESERSDRECGTMALQQQQPPSHRPLFCQPTLKWTLIRDNADSAPRKGVGLRSPPGHDNCSKARDLCSTDRCLSITEHALCPSLSSASPPSPRSLPSRTREAKDEKRDDERYVPPQPLFSPLGHSQTMSTPQKHTS